MFGTFRKLAYTLLSPKFYTGFALGFATCTGLVANDFVSTAFAYTFGEPTLIEQDQEFAKKLTGDYFSDISDPNFQVFTYEKVCKGFYTVEKSGDTIITTGYGDAADDYTSTERIVKIPYVASSTDPIKTEPTDIVTDVVDVISTSTDIRP